MHFFRLPRSMAYLMASSSRSDRLHDGKCVAGSSILRRSSRLNRWRDKRNYLLVAFRYVLSCVDAIGRRLLPCSRQIAFSRRLTANGFCPCMTQRAPSSLGLPRLVLVSVFATLSLACLFAFPSFSSDTAGRPSSSPPSPSAATPSAVGFPSFSSIAVCSFL